MRPANVARRPAPLLGDTFAWLRAQWPTREIPDGGVFAFTSADARTARTPGRCHGSAGLVHLHARFHHATGGARFADAARRWRARLIDGLDETQPLFGLRAALPQGRGARRGLLGGAAGVLLALLAALAETPPRWDQAMLLDGGG